MERARELILNDNLEGYKKYMKILYKTARKELWNIFVNTGLFKEYEDKKFKYLVCLSKYLYLLDKYSFKVVLKLHPMYLFPILKALNIVSQKKLIELICGKYNIISTIKEDQILYLYRRLSMCSVDIEDVEFLHYQLALKGITVPSIQKESIEIWKNKYFIYEMNTLFNPKLIELCVLALKDKKIEEPIYIKKMIENPKARYLPESNFTKFNS